MPEDDKVFASETEQAPSAKPGFARRVLGLLRPRLSVASLFWITLISAILLLWYRDHQKLSAQIQGFNTKTSPSWSIDQLLGLPNTAGFGDISTAWAAASQSNREEWVVVEFPKTVEVAEIHVYETYNPGALAQIYAVDMTGDSRLIWNGKDPLRNSGSPGGVAKIKLAATERTRRIRLVLDSAGIPGWNEIDAVGLVDSNGNTQWASQSWASSSYGKNRELPTWFWP